MKINETSIVSINFICRFVIQDLSMEKQFLLDVDISVCFEANGPCMLTSNILKNARLPKPLCDLSTSLSFGGM